MNSLAANRSLPAASVVVAVVPGKYRHQDVTIRTAIRRVGCTVTGNPRIVVLFERRHDHHLSRPPGGSRAAMTASIRPRSRLIWALVTMLHPLRFETGQTRLDALEHHGLHGGAHRRQHVDQFRADIELGRPHAHFPVDRAHFSQNTRQAIQVADLRGRPGRPYSAPVGAHRARRA